ncbi:Uncharacterized protein OBRU01_05853 [Operophtera brumata]|uniref:Uncharacterized protein n=1 Tax=Operophtera brumata TaxID=104452 RepID=A0A0L7LLS1_OPEBR|nr:Uncharacterized protein OBRU01_05853 [Operophtera brumata]
MECLNGLKNLGIDVQSWDLIVIYIVSSKLDVESRKLWETKISSHDQLPALVEFREFLEARSRALEFLDVKPKAKVNVNKAKVHHAAAASADNNSNGNTSCPYCKETHKIANCKQFAKEGYKARHDFVQTKRLCFNCLGSNHSVKYCRSYPCSRLCKRKHNSLLHPDNSSSSSAVSESNTTAEVKSAVSAVKAALSEGESSSPKLASHFSQRSIPTQVLLATALVEAQARHGSSQMLRVLLDQGSQTSFITESAAGGRLERVERRTSCWAASDNLGSSVVDSTSLPGADNASTKSLGSSSEDKSASTDGDGARRLFEIVPSLPSEYLM